MVEAYPKDMQGRKVSASFLYKGTRSLFERAGFEYQRPKGKNHCVMRLNVPPLEQPRWRALFADLATVSHTLVTHVPS